MFWKKSDKLFFFFITAVTFLSFALLSFIIFFIFKKSFPLFKEVSISDFIFGKRWRPYSETNPSMGIYNIITATIYVAFTGTLIALPVAVGCSIFLSCVLSEKIKNIIKPYIDILAGIPSVIYGFMGLVIIVKFFENLGRASGESVLSGGILLSIMILPFMIDTCEETMSSIKKRYENSSKALGVSKWYMVSELILPASIKSIFIALVLALGRALGETMAVMMVIGNAPIFPHLLGKAQTISSLIALEMGMVEVGGLHYNALFASGLVLMIMILIINIFINFFRKKFIGDER